ncbi:MAG: hypothetical protein M0Q91_16905 [Methanoregula sp.]|jgi:hypothetical protein|nr:hypothetical protein [Methanoregula sp.]
MNESLELLFPKFDLNDFLRNIYPGLIITLFIFLQFQYKLRHFFGKEPIYIFLFFSIFVIISGYFFTGIYRAFIYFIIIRFIEQEFGFFPQSKFHLYLVNKLKIKNKEIETKLNSFSFISACVASILSRDNTHGEVIRFNSHVHLIFMSSFLTLIIGIIYTFFYDYNPDFTLLFIILFFISFIAGILTDYQADLREILILKENEVFYSENLQKYLNFLEQSSEISQ